MNKNQLQKEGLGYNPSMKKSYVKTVMFVAEQKPHKSIPLIKMNGSEQARSTQTQTTKTNLKNKGKKRSEKSKTRERTLL